MTPGKPQIYSKVININGFPGGSVAKNMSANAGDSGLIPGLGRSSGEGNGKPLHYSCLENPIDRGAWRATVHRVAKSRAQLNTHACVGLGHSSEGASIRNTQTNSSKLIHE